MMDKKMEKKSKEMMSKESKAMPMAKKGKEAKGMEMSCMPESKVM